MGHDEALRATLHQPIGREAMPLIQVHLAAGRTDDQKKVLLAAITDAVQRSVGAPVDSIRVWITEFQPTEYMAGGTLLADRE
jgi:4-oxalocrotonate tautomerase